MNIPIPSDELVQCTPGKFLGDNILNLSLAYRLQQHHSSLLSCSSTTTFFTTKLEQKKATLRHIAKEGVCWYLNDYVFIPHHVLPDHWALLIICNPKSLLAEMMTPGLAVTTPAKGQTCILYLDSDRNPSHRVPKVTQDLKSFLIWHLKCLFPHSQSPMYPSCPIYMPRVPQQSPGTNDCGFFVLCFVDTFLRSPMHIAVPKECADGVRIIWASTDQPWSDAKDAPTYRQATLDLLNHLHQLTVLEEVLTEYVQPDQAALIVKFTANWYEYTLNFLA